MNRHETGHEVAGRGAPATWEFGGFRLEPGRRLLISPEGASIPITAKAYDALYYLVLHAGQLVPRTALQQALWPTTIVEDNNLNQAIAALRRVLGEGHIITVAGRGYQFVTAVTAGESASAALAAPTPVPAPAPIPTPRSRTFPRLLLGLAGFAVAIIGIVTLYAGMQRSELSAAPYIGAVERITPLTAYPGDELWPTLSPDGTRVAFSWDGGVSKLDIYALRIGAASPARLTQALDGEDRNPAWSPDGSAIAFLRWQDPVHSDVMIVPAAGGTERKLASIQMLPVTSDYASPMIAWTPDSKALLVTTQVEGTEDAPAWRFHLLSMDTGAMAPLAMAADDLDYDISPAFSQDGRRLAFARFRHDQQPAPGKLMIQDLGPGFAPEGQPYAVTDGTTVPHSPAWSPDGRLLTFVVGVTIFEWDGSAVRAAYPMLSNMRSLLRKSGLAMNYDGTHVRAVVANSNDDPDIWALPLDPNTHLAIGPPLQRVASTQLEMQPQLSPDGRQLAFLSFRSGKLALWLASREGEGVRLLAQIDDALGIGFPAWSPDGRQIAFLVPTPNQASIIYSVDIDAGVPKPLFNGCCPRGWSKDGQYLYVTDIGTVNTVVRVRVATGERERLFRGELAIETTDGSKLLYTKLGEFGIFARSLAGDPAQNPEERLVDDYTPLLGSIVPVADGFFYLGLTRIGQPRAFRFFDYATRTAKDVAVAAPSVNIGMTVSPDGRELLYAANAIESGTDLMLIEFAPAP